jgi:hypothetical protein
MALNTRSPATFTTGILVGNTVASSNGSIDSIPVMTRNGGETVSAALEVQSTDGALLISRMSTDQRAELRPYKGMIIYNKTTDTFNIYQAGAWREMGDVVGPSPSAGIENYVAVFADDTGKRLKVGGNVAITTGEAPAHLLPYLPSPETPVDTLSGLEILQFQGFGNITLSDGVDEFSILNLALDGITGKRTALFTDGSVSVPTTSSAIVELGSTTGALLLSRLTTAQIGELDAVDGMLVYDTDTNHFLMHQDGAWIIIDDGGPGDGTVTSVATGTGLTGGPITTTGTISIADTTVTAGDYTYASFSVNAQGQLTAASSGAAPALADATYILQTADVNLPNAQSLGGLTTGILLNTVTGSSGVLSRAIPGTDYYSPGFPTYLKESSVGNLFVGSGAGDSLTSGIDNTGIGINALHFTTLGASNTALGAAALGANVAGASNTAIGATVLAANVGGLQNTGVGALALAANVSGQFNTGIGAAALTTNITGSRNSALGADALFGNGGSDCTAVGFSALYYNLSSGNTALGSYALTSNINGGSNCAVGYQALYSNVDSSANTAVGWNSLYANVSGLRNSSLGASSLSTNTTGSDNVALGNECLSNNGDGDRNVGVGSYCLLQLNGGNDNVSIGYNSQYTASSANYNVSMGSNSLNLNTGSGNTAVGHNALANNGSPGQNSAFGFEVLRYNASGTGNSGFGNEALSSNISGSRSSAFGFNALTASLQSDNTAMGYNALASNVDGNQNCSFGSGALFANVDGVNNVAIGYNVLGSSLSDNNTGVGAGSLSSLINGDQNVGLGSNSLANNVNGSNNVALGVEAGGFQAAYTDCVFIGTGADASVSGLTNAIAIGKDAAVDISNALILGNGCSVGIGETSPQYPLHIGNVGNVAAIYLEESTTTPAAPATGLILYSDPNDLFYRGNAKTVNITNALESTYIVQTSNANIPNAQALDTLGGGILKAELDGSISIAVPEVDYATESEIVALEGEIAVIEGEIDTLTAAVAAAAGTAGSALTLATALTTPKYIVQEADATLTNEQSLGALTTGLLKNTVTGTTGVLSTAVAGTDYYAPGFPTRLLDTSGSSTYNVFMGTSAGNTTLTGLRNSGFGYQALNSATSGSNNSALGYLALGSNSSGGSNTALGYLALSANTTSGSNTAVGASCMSMNNGGTSNTGIGANALLSNDVGIDNTAAGFNAMRDNTSGTSNAAFGRGALSNLVSGSFNTGLGMSALGNTTSDDNVGIGYQAMSANTSGTQNVGCGKWVLRLNSLGSNNTALGYNAGSARLNYTQCVFLGSGADASVNSLTNAVAIGYNASVGASNSMVLGNGCNVGIGTSSPANILHIVGTFQQKGITTNWTGTDNIKGQVSLQTTTSGTSALLTIPVPTSPNTAVHANINLVAMYSGGTAAAYAKSNNAAFYNGASTINIGAAPAITVTTQGGFTGTAAWGLSGNNLVLNVGGVAATTINWVCTYEYFSVRTTIT